MTSLEHDNGYKTLIWFV